VYRADTIIASATASGRAAVAVVRLSGPDAFAIAGHILRLVNSERPRPWMLHRCTAVDPDNGEPLDDGLAVWIPAPRTYTGEDIVEIHCHGSPVVVESVISAGTRAGARLAERGEFTRRAVLNGRMDLAQAEAVADLVDARVRGGARLAWEQLQGGLSGRLRGLRASIVGVLSDIEANVDFSDDDLPEEKTSPRIDALEAARNEIGCMLEGFIAARRWREGYRVVFTGQPNVGKSSLVNALLGYGRMIVSDEPGTTRDVVEETVDLEGCAFVLADTAGVRESSSEAETKAVGRTMEKLAEADIVVQVFDVTAAATLLGAESSEVNGSSRRLVVLNKCDLVPHLRAVDVVASQSILPHAVIETSAHTGQGCDTLVAALVAIARKDREELHETATSISRVRHRVALEEATNSISTALELLHGGVAPELVSIELRTALGHLAAVTEPVDNEEVLDRIFRDFCIGK